MRDRGNRASPFPIPNLYQFLPLCSVYDYPNNNGYGIKQFLFGAFHLYVPINSPSRPAS